MSEHFNTERVMDRLRDEIRKKNIHKESLSYTTAYYSKILNRLKKEKEIVLFGCGMYGKLLYDNISFVDINNIECFCDNNKAVVGKDYKGRRVYSPNEAFEKFPEACFVITPVGFENEILLQLIDIGVNINKILVVNMLFTGLTDL